MGARQKLKATLPNNRIRRLLLFSATAVFAYFVALCLWLALVNPAAFGPVVLGFIAGALAATASLGVLASVLAAQLWVCGPDLAQEGSPARQRWDRLVQVLKSSLAESEVPAPAPAVPASPPAPAAQAL